MICENAFGVAVATEKKHAVFSASGSKRWLTCPGSINLSIGMPTEESDAAKEGTRAHECLEFLLKNPGQLLGAAAAARKVYGTEMTEFCLSAAREILKRRKDGDTIQIETRASLEFIEPDTFGTVDVALLAHDDSMLTIIDFKYGRWVVEPKENTQLMYYAVGIAKDLAQRRWFKQVRLVIIQPRAPHDEGIVREWTVHGTELHKWENMFREGIGAAKDPFADLVTGEHCGFCPAASICPKLKEEAFERTKIAFVPEANQLVVPDTMPTTAELSFALTACDKLDTWTKAVRAHAFQRMQRGHTIPGWKLVERRPTRKWRGDLDLSDLKDEAHDNFGDHAFTEEMKSPAQLEKLGAVAKAWVAKHTVKESSGLTMAPDSDRRDEIKTIEADYQPFQEVSDASVSKPRFNRTNRNNRFNRFKKGK